MTLIIKYFGMTAEASGKEEEVDTLSYSSVQDLREALVAKYPELGNVNYKVAANQTIVADDYLLTGNEEIALLPPFAGG